ncbi:MAG: hypothetical protein HY368_02210 [Candidatus Aenigmarchaeota archaeon]|nr:hypothetical protein [Candidatus Aenigmarchaeota archaeon]
MPIIGLNLTSINAEVNEKAARGGNININSTPRIIDIDRKDLNVAGIKDILAVEFSFETKYDPDVGKITFTGEVLYQAEETKNVLNKWKKEKKLDDELTVEILNAVFRKCLAEGVSIANELRLPPPVSFPVVKTKEEGEGYVG